MAKNLFGVLAGVKQGCVLVAVTLVYRNGLSTDGLIERSLTAANTGRRFYRSKDPTSSIQVLKEHVEYTNNTKIQ